ncbi:uncharacterized protein MELLADRAFT_78143 [Melampsora larici-populina 98AG31]|uniref:Uncharacterized protein n=1 Tax=Melampsora larici-populina (strain 98AG31 / pathotype 3-4-7) TaxID=747676 RepID=F4RQV0_MELLP|nr:uncharacterized protein MELLADRAFT_78143 [Melampsora larici-populina 98AG31]EGG05104.1 hypothetical protein MELLADRAFT_78143 [Melampsora larici-populina 98AG31]
MLSTTPSSSSSTEQSRGHTEPTQAIPKPLINNTQQSINHEEQQQQQPTPPDIPVHITLLYLTHLHLTTASKISRTLMTRPSYSYQLFGTPSKPNPTETETHQSHIIQYRRHILIAINCLRSILYGSESLQIPIQFKFNALIWLIKILINETHSNRYQLDQLVQYGFLIIKKSGLQLDHDSRFELTELDILISLQDSTISFRQIKKQVERAIELTYQKNGSIHAKSIKWYYRFQILYIQINSPKDYSSTQETIQSVLKTSLTRGDQEVHILFKAIEIKLALDHSLFTLVGDLVDSIIKLVGFKPNESSTTLKLCKPLESFLVVLIGFYYYEMGEIELGKEWVAYLYRIIEDLQLDNGSFKVFIDSSVLPNHSTVQIDSPFTRKFGQISMLDEEIRNEPKSDVAKDFIWVKLMPIELIQALVSLISASIHLDAYGKRPKALTYLNEGIQKIDEFLMKGIKVRFSEMSNCIQRLIRMKIEGILMMSQMSIIRSNFLLADQNLLDLIRITTLTQQWPRYASRICFLKAMLSQSTMNFSLAKQSLSSSLRFLKPLSIQIRKQIKVLVITTSLMLEIDEVDHSNQCQEWLEELKAFEGVSNRSRIALEIVLALKCGEIVRAK